MSNIDYKPNYKQHDRRIFYISHTTKGQKNMYKIVQDTFDTDEKGEIRKDSYSRPVMKSKEVELAYLPGVTREWIPPISFKTKRFVTGLDVMIPNPYSDQSYYPSEKFEKALSGRPTAKLQHILEYEHNVPFDHYTSEFPTMDEKGNPKFHSIYFNKNVSWKCDNSVSILNMENTMHQLLYFALCYRGEDANPVVALNLKEFDEDINIKNTCRFVFLDENDSAEDKIESEKDLSELYHYNYLLTREEALRDNLSLKIMKAMEIVGFRNLTLSRNPSMAANELFTVLKAIMPHERKEIYKMIMMAGNPDRAEEFNAYVLIGEGLIYDKIVKTNDSYKFFIVKDGQRTESLYISKEEAVKNFFLNPKMEPVVLEFKKTVESAKINDNI